MGMALAEMAPIETAKFGKIILDISNSVLPLEKLSSTASARDGLSEEMEIACRSSGCDLIQICGRLLKLPQVAMATASIIFQRFYYSDKSLVRHPYDVVAMACLVLASKIEESPRRVRDIINVFAHVKQVRSEKPIEPVVLDQNYINLKNQIIKAERRVLKELGFCVHVKHPHKIIVMYLKWLECDTHKELLQMSWNFMNDALRTDVFVRYAPETIATACIYLSARKLKVPMPKSPSWFDVLSVEEDDIKDCCYRMICLYNRKKPNQMELEKVLETLRKKVDENRRVVREQNVNQVAAPSSPSTTNDNESHTNGNSKNHRISPSTPSSPLSRKKKKHKRTRSESINDERSRTHTKKSKKSHRKSLSKSPEDYSPGRKSKKSYKDKYRYRSRSREHTNEKYSRHKDGRTFHTDSKNYRNKAAHERTGDNYYRR